MRDNTARKQVDENQEGREKELQTILDSVPVCIFYMDAASRFVHVNEVLAKRYGLKPDDFKGKTSRELFPEEADEYIKSDREVLASGEEQIGAINRIKTPEGVRWVRLDKVPIKDVEGNVTGIIGFELDVTARKQAEDALRESEKEHQTILDSVPVSIFHMDAASRFVHVNEALAKRYGMKPEDFTGKSSRELFPEKAEEYIESDREVLESGEEQIGAIKKIKTPEGVRWVRLDKVPIKDADGNVTGIIGFELDLTDLKRVEGALQGRKRELQTVLDSVPVSIFYIDSESRFVHVNEFLAEYYGMKPEDFRGKTTEELFPGKADEYIKGDKTILESGEPRIGRIKKLTTPEGVRWVRLDKVPIKDADGNVTGIIGFALDFTERKRVEDNLKGLSKVSQIDLTKDLNQILKEILDIVRGEMEARAGSILLVNNETGELEMVAVSGFHDEYIQEVHHRGVLSTSPSGVVLETGEYYLVPNIFEEPKDKPWADLGRELNFSAQIFMPLKQKGEVIGVMAVYMAEPHEFTEDEITFVSIAAGQAAAIIEDARLYANVLKQKEELERENAERKQAEKALRASEKQLRETRDYLNNVIESSVDAIVVVDMDGIVRDWNKGAEDYMGYTADEVIGTPNRKFFADPEEADRILELVRREGEVRNNQTIALRKDGMHVHISMSAALLRDKNGVPIGTVRVSRDITKVVELEEQIKEERDNLNLIFESMVDGVYLCSPDYEIEFMNRVLIDEFGDQVGGICYNAFHGREEPCPLCKHPEVMKRKTVRWEWHSRRANKTYDIIETPLKNINGTVSKLTIFGDITKRKQMEEALRDSKERLKTILDTIPSGVVMIDAEAHKIVDANPVALDMIGAPKEKVLGSECHQYICPAERGQCPITDKGQFVDNSERVLLNANGEIVPILKTVIPIHLDGRKHLLESFVDITERKQAEKMQLQLINDLESANEELRNFMHAATHDLKTPLRGISSLAEWMVTDYADTLDEEGKERLDMMMRRVKRMYGLLDGILYYSTIGHVEGEREVLNLNTVVSETIAAVEPPENIEIEVVNELPGIYYDKTLIEDVFQNLLSNAVRYMDKPVGKVTVGCTEDEDGYWKFRVADNGPGIDERYHEKIFQSSRR